MENLKETLKSIWTKEIEIRFNKGLITYERQLQAELYRLLKKELNDEEKYEVWVEPVLYKIFPWHIIKPDIIITNEKEKLIIGIIEIKFKPWEEINSKHDLKKLKGINDHQKKEVNLKVTLGYNKPYSSNLEEQKNSSREYTFNADYLNVIIAFGNDSHAFEINEDEKPNNFLHLIGYIDNSQHDSVFRIK